MIQVNNLCKSYDGFALKNVSFDVQKGYITGFIGQNGAGKTTVIKSILNLINIDAGTIRIMGLDSVKDSVAIKDRIGVVLDDGIFYDHLTLKEMKNINASFYKHWDEQAYHSFIQKFGLEENKRIQDLSKGMRMKYSLALAFSHKADLLIMDEPTSGLDPIIREELLDVLQEMMMDENKTVFFSTHITTDLEKVADYLVFIENGSILLNGPKDEILDGHVIVKGSAAQLSSEIENNSIYIYRKEHSFEALIKTSFQLEGGLSHEKPSIEDIMRYYVKSEGGK